MDAGKLGVASVINPSSKLPSARMVRVHGKHKRGHRLDNEGTLGNWRLSPISPEMVSPLRRSKGCGGI